MNETKTVAVTIARQLGCGGAALGARLAQRLGYVFLDREIIAQAAETLGVDEAAFAEREERVATFWRGLLDTFARGVPEEVCSPHPLLAPMEHSLFEAQQRALQDLAARGDCVVVGRGGFMTLSGVAWCVNVFLHASTAYRAERLVLDGRAHDHTAATAMLPEADAARERYIREVTGAQWRDARNYDLCLDVGRLGMDAVETLVAQAVAEMVGCDVGHGGKEA